MIIYHCNRGLNVMNKDELYMRRALDIAINGMGEVSPNPLVGSVIVVNDHIIAEGWHEKYGGPHAEVNAIRQVINPEILREATVYVSLEPCAHHGKTPPCADLLIAMNVEKVVIAIRDPNPQVAGQGIERLKAAGIDVLENVLEEEARAMNIRFFTSMEKKRPFILLKWAQTKDGFIAREDYSSKWISSDASRALVHKWRSEESSILIGPDTALYDNPSLTVREWKGKDPVRIVLDRFGRLPGSLNVFTDGGSTWYYSTLPDKKKRTGRHIQLPEENFLHSVMDDLYQNGIQSVMVEGGATILKNLIDANLWDEARIFVSDKTFVKGIKAPGIPAGKMTECRYPEDVLIRIKNDW
jgi:diaminohydroxyphosphoribosylaminopyrimidine deaminase/5-amino-6-(5-phosphoribosylamino)uracil reductase